MCLVFVFLVKGNLGYDDVTFFRTFSTSGVRDHYLVPIRGAVWGTRQSIMMHGDTGSWCEVSRV